MRLLGGEPTLHPEVDAFVDLALERAFHVSIFTNGLIPENTLRHLEEIPGDRLALVVNVNGPDDQTPAEAARQATVLSRLGRKARLGFNIYRPAPQLAFLLVLIDRHDLCRVLRLGLAHPCLDRSNAFLRPPEYPKVGRAVADFARVAWASGVELDFDCGFVPCMFPKDFLEELGDQADLLGSCCGPVPDFLPDGAAVHCYPLGARDRIDVSDASRIEKLRSRLSRRFAPYRALGIYRECLRCPHRDSGRCNGGCLAAALQRVRPSVIEALPPTASSSPSFSEPRTAPSNAAAVPSSPKWAIPYIDQPIEFWQDLAVRFGSSIAEVYFPWPEILIGSGRSPLPRDHLASFLRDSPFPRALLLNPVVLPEPVGPLAPRVVSAVRRLDDQFGLASVTVTDLLLGRAIRQALPHLSITASVLADIHQPYQLLALDGICDTLVVASRSLRDLPALQALRLAFPGRLRLIVNEGCLPGCPYRSQHFYEMAAGFPLPRSLCQSLLDQHPWLRLTGAWVLPQHLHLYDGLYDDLKLAGRVTLADPEKYRRVLGAYVRREPLGPHEIGGGPAAPLQPLEIPEAFFAHTLSCGKRCDRCDICRTYYDRCTARTAFRARPAAIASSAEDATTPTPRFAAEGRA